MGISPRGVGGTHSQFRPFLGTIFGRLPGQLEIHFFLRKIALALGLSKSGLRFWLGLRGEELEPPQEKWAKMGDF